MGRFELALHRGCPAFMGPTKPQGPIRPVRLLSHRSANGYSEVSKLSLKCHFPWCIGGDCRIRRFSTSWSWVTEDHRSKGGLHLCNLVGEVLDRHRSPLP